MLRFFPRAGSGARRSATGLAVGCLLIAGLTAPMPAQAREDDGLHHRQHRVEQAIERARTDLDEVSQDLVDASAALRRAEGKLATARDRLAAARGEVAAAEVIDERTQAELDEARQRLEEARLALHSGALLVVRQRSRVAALAVDQFEGDNLELLELSAVLDGDSPLELGNRMAAVGDLLNQGAASLDRLKATRVLLSVQEERVAMAKQLVAERRAAAAANLARTQAAKDRAAEAKRDVARLVDSRTRAQQAARAAVREERHRLAALREERERIRKLLAERARRALLRSTAESDAGPSSGYLELPVDGPITSSYGLRMHPILNVLRMHDGTDFGAACGTPVHAAAAGVVFAAYYDAGYGNRLIIDNGVVRGVNVSTSYNHLSRTVVSAGERVERGEVVGYVGSTGYSTGCHLHFSVYENGRTVDPVTWL